MARLQELSGREKEEREAYYNEILMEYSENNMKKLRNLINYRALHFVKSKSNMDYDDFLSMANMQLWRILLSFDPEQNDNVHMYIKAKMCLKMRQEATYRNREKRRQYQRDENGNPVLDEKRRPIFIYDKRIDEVDENGVAFIDTLYSSSDTYKEAVGEEYSDEYEEYMRRLGKKQRKVAIKISEGYTQVEIAELLHMELKEVKDCVQELKESKNISIFYRR